VSWPDSIVMEIPTEVADEIVRRLGDSTSAATLVFQGDLRREVDNARAQKPLFGGPR
jgi:hypothetical protein